MADISAASPGNTYNYYNNAVLNNDRLIDALQSCFSDLLKIQEEQATKLDQVVAALEQNARPTTDKKTTFWNLYKNLADEHDKEIQQRYSTDLDTSLIFAGLFSAIESAFIIQIQPEIRPLGTPRIIVFSESSG
ncbi:hypothetical protein B0H13DRAFT_2661887 [Mycena leptocephala]|nr:hypothetical protein B0H13DRAFT_2661887 [Mycena leptocephala]